MRETNPGRAPNVPVITELNWRIGMEPNTLYFNTVYWVRKTGKFYEYTGILHDVVVREVPGDKDDYDWLKNIGALT